METKASARYVRISARKTRLVIDAIRGRDLDEARQILDFSDRAAAREISKVLRSAEANAENNNGLSPDNLFVSRCFVDEGPTLKRFRPRAMGRATRINKRTCHITVVLDEREPSKARAKRGRLRKAITGRGKGTREAEMETAELTEEELAAEEAAEDLIEEEEAAEELEETPEAEPVEGDEAEEGSDSEEDSEEPAGEAGEAPEETEAEKERAPDEKSEE